MKPIQRGIRLFSMMMASVLLVFFFFQHQLVLMVVVVAFGIAFFTFAESSSQRIRKKMEDRIAIPWYTHSSLFFALGWGLLAITFLVAQVAFNLNEFFTTFLTSSSEIPSWYTRFFQIMMDTSLLCFLVGALSTFYYSLWTQSKLRNWKRRRAEKKRRLLPSSAEDDPESWTPV